MNKKFTRLGCLLCACALLGGCVGQSEGSAKPQVTLPAAESVRQAPENDSLQAYEQSVVLYLPSPDGSQLLAVPRQATLNASRHEAKALAELLLSQPATEITLPVGGDIALALSEADAVEVSGQVATVSLSASALRLTNEQLFTVGQALANTLCQFGDLQFVNVLISGFQPGMNIAATLPAGCYQANGREDLSSLWARASTPLNNSRRSFVAALYFPAPSGKGILCEARTLSFQFQDLSSMALTLLDALSHGAETLPSMPKCPEFRSLLRETPTIEETGGTRRLVLRFTDRFNSALIDAGITRSVMMASLVYTLTTFLPGIEGVEIRIGDERINSLTPSGTYNGAGEMISFSDGLMRRRDFSGFLLAECELYFAGEDGALHKVYRPVPFYEARSPRALIEQMMQGPQSCDSQTGLKAVLPSGLRPADLLGTAYEDNVNILNFSSQMAALCQDMTAEEEKLMIYAMVNTLCRLRGIKRVSFFIQGKQEESLAGHVYLPGDFLPNLDLVK